MFQFHCWPLKSLKFQQCSASGGCQRTNSTSPQEAQNLQKQNPSLWDDPIFIKWRKDEHFLFRLRTLDAEIYIWWLFSARFSQIQRGDLLKMRSWCRFNERSGSQNVKLVSFSWVCSGWFWTFCGPFLISAQFVSCFSSRGVKLFSLQLSRVTKSSSELPQSARKPPSEVVWPPGTAELRCPHTTPDKTQLQLTVDN